MSDRHAAVDRWIAWAKEHESSVTIVARYEIKNGKLLRVVVQPPEEEHKVLDPGGAAEHTSAVRKP